MIDEEYVKQLERRCALLEENQVELNDLRVRAESDAQFMDVLASELVGYAVSSSQADTRELRMHNLEENIKRSSDHIKTTMECWSGDACIFASEEMESYRLLILQGRGQA